MKIETTLKVIASSLLILSFNASATDGDVSEGTGACNVAMTKGDAATAVIKADEALKIKPTHHQAWLCKGRALGAQGNYAEALKALEQGEKTATDQFEGIISYILIGNLHRQNNKNSEAIASYEQSLKICVESKNGKFERINHNLIGETQAENNNNEAALASYLAGNKLSMNDNERADSFERIAATYLAIGQLDKATENQLTGLLMQLKAGTPDQIAAAHIALGNLYMQAKDYTNAESTYGKLVKYAKDNGGAYYEGKGTLLMGNAKLAANDVPAAKQLLSDADKIAKSIKDAELIAEVDASLKKLPK